MLESRWGRILCVAIVIGCLSTASHGWAVQPNVLLIVTDDQRPDTVGALGNPIIRTPNLDALVARGTSFVNAYAGYPICHVSRAEILTGCMAFRALPQYPNGPIDPSLATLARTFQAAGYQTWYSGKWHNDGQPKQRGYAATRGLYSSGGSSKDARGPSLDDRGNPRTGYTGWTFKTEGGLPDLDKGVGLQPTNSLHIADAAIQAIRETPSDKPFFVHVNFAFPHDPRQWPADPNHRYGIDQVPLPRNFASSHPFDHGNLDGRDEQLLPRPRDPLAVRTELAIYYAMISDVDAQMGRILSAASEFTQRGTIVVMTSDQGLAMGSHGLLGKQNQYQHSIRAPLIFAGPGIPASQKLDSLVMLRDIFPTLCELSEIPIPESVQGISCVPLMRGRLTHTRDFVTGVFTDTQRMICNGNWKLIVYPQVHHVQLFDIKNDPDERTDQSGNDDYAGIRSELYRKLRLWCDENGDPLKI